MSIMLSSAAAWADNLPDADKQAQVTNTETWYVPDTHSTASQAGKVVILHMHFTRTQFCTKLVLAHCMLAHSCDDLPQVHIGGQPRVIQSLLCHR